MAMSLENRVAPSAFTFHGASRKPNDIRLNNNNGNNFQA